jgi:hypothetical protein
MEPMKPMAPMRPMEPMKQMEPIDFGPPWWPTELGEPSSAGAQNGMRYAFFPEKRRLLVERDGKKAVYDTADHQISGVSQQSGHSASLVFSSQSGNVALDTLHRAGNG